MRLPQQILQSPWFLFSDEKELISALNDRVEPDELEHITFLSKRRLPPVTSMTTLGAMIGINAGLIWSFANRPGRHYRTFEIPKGKGKRTITSPRVGLKIIQKWLSYHFTKTFVPAPHVFGFVPGKSHIQAAYTHSGASWAFSVDIKDFFQTTPRQVVSESLERLGYSKPSATLLSQLTCLRGFLAQGAPSSPVLSNMCLSEMDFKLSVLATFYNCKLTRYADDITFSATHSLPDALKSDVRALFLGSPWQLSPEKELTQPLKGRIKVHGLIVNNGQVRLTKGYRNKIRAYSHVLSVKEGQVKNVLQLKGHVEYAKHVTRILNKLDLEASKDH